MTDPMDLPVRSVKKQPGHYTTLVPESRGGLTERQRDVLVSSAANIAMDLMEIVKLRAQTQQEIDLIEARSQALRVAIRGEIDKMQAARDTLVSRGDVVVRLTRELLQNIADVDPATRQTMLETLTRLVDSTINAKGADAASGA
jgi:hypothetical protein